MKKNFFRAWFYFQVVTASFFLSCSMGFASTDLDRQFKLETVGYLRAWDNVDGLFADYIASAYQEYFAHQTRFVLNDLSRAMQVLNTSKLPYLKIIQDFEILRQLTRVTRTESLIRTQVVKDGGSYLFTLDWLYSPRMEILGTVQFAMEEPKEGEGFSADQIIEVVNKNLDELLSQFPFSGHVTGRDGNSVIVNIGHTKLKKGDVLSIATLDDVKIHPLLKKIVDWHSVPTGQVIVDQIEDAIAFCKILEEEPGQSISRYQKIVHIRSKPVVSDDGTVPVQEIKAAEIQEAPPQTGWIGGTLLVGGYDRDFSSLSGGVSGSGSNTGGGLTIGSRAEAEIWLTKAWFTGLEFGYSFWNFSQTDSLTGEKTAASQNGGVSGSLFSFKLDFGYSYLFSADPLGPKIYLKAGYKSNSYSLPVSIPEGTGPISFSSIFLGLGGDLPLVNKWGLLGRFNFGLLSFINQTWLADSINTSSDVEFFIGAYYRLKPRLMIRGGIDIVTSGATFSSTGSNLSQKSVTIAPALLYYF